MFIKLEHYSSRFDPETRLHVSEPLTLNTASIAHIVSYSYHLGKNTYEEGCGLVRFVDGSTVVLSRRSHEALVSLLEPVTVGTGLVKS